MNELIGIVFVCSDSAESRISIFEKESALSLEQVENYIDTIVEKDFLELIPNN